MQATYTTVVGRIATAAERQTFASGASRVTFRVASTERRRDAATGSWTDGERLYITVRCWRQLGDHVLASTRLGDPVIVHGRLISRSVERDGTRTSVTEIDADAVGPDLRWATAVVTRTSSASTAPAEPVRAGEGLATAAGEDDTRVGPGGAPGAVTEPFALRDEPPEESQEALVGRVHEPGRDRTNGAPPTALPAEAGVGA